MRTAQILSALLMTLFATACGLPIADPLEKGDCLNHRGNGDLTEVSCAGTNADYVVLERFPFDEKQASCHGVAGTVRTYFDAISQYGYCLGDRRFPSTSGR